MQQTDATKTKVPQQKESDRLFRELLKALRPLFLENGFQRRSQNFIQETPECWVIINFQKSRYSNTDETTFYVNVAATTKRWLGFEGRPSDGVVPPYYGCDWSWRVEHFIPGSKTQHWTLTDEESLRETYKDLAAAFRDHLFPATERMLTEADLLQQTGGFEYPQLKTRSVIQAATNQVGPLKQTLATLMTKFSGTVSEGILKHIEALRCLYPDVMHAAGQ